MKVFNRYTEKGNRLAIFGEVVDNNTDAESVKVTIFKTSKKDQFEKSIAHQLYEVDQLRQEILASDADATVDFYMHTPSKDGMQSHQVHPEYHFLPIMSGDTPAYTFHRWIRKNFYKKVISNVILDDEIPVYVRIVPHTTKVGTHFHTEITKLTKRG